MVELQTEEPHWGSRFPGKLIWYSPAQVLVMAGISSENIHIFLPLAIIVGLQVHFLVSVYQSFVKDKQVLFEEVSREYNSKFVYPRIFVRKFDKQVSTETDTLDLNSSSRDQVDSFQFTSDRKSRNFQHLSVPASRFSTHSTNSLRSRNSPQLSQSPGDSRASSSNNSDDDQADDDEDDEEEEEEEEGEEEEEELNDEDRSEESSEDEDEESESDSSDVEPVIPHPTNSLNF
ncbi:hypothetical protein BGZ76_001175 [Entomortierella beljakovae]|nr:hypothetical protein BGZ76_001175 [Entomortierella beljakovae]